MKSQLHEESVEINGSITCTIESTILHTLICCFRDSCGIVQKKPRVSRRDEVDDDHEVDDDCVILSWSDL